MSIDKGSEALFVNSLSSIAKDGYLGDVWVVSSVLREAAYRFFAELPKLKHVSDIDGLIRSVGKKYMRIFLGSNNKYRPVRNWNMPGAIDVFVAKWCGVDEDKPTDRMIGGFASMIDELVDLELMAKDPDIEKKQWDWQIEAIFEKYSMLFMGITPPLQWAT